MLIDTHAHLCDPRFDADRDEVIARAFAAGVEKIIEIAYHEPLWEKARTLAEKYPGKIYWAAGLHPGHAEEYDDDLPRRLAEALKHPQAVAVGEIGFDYYHNAATAPLQKIVLGALWEVAQNAGKPVVLHCRNSRDGALNAYNDLISFLEVFAIPSPAPGPQSSVPVFKGVAHCYQGPPATARTLMNLGLLLGVDGPLTYPNAGVLRATINEIPLDHLLLETDSPYLPPQTQRGRRNEPAFIADVAGEVARLKGLSVERAAAETARNARELFHLA